MRIEINHVTFPFSRGLFFTYTFLNLVTTFIYCKSGYFILIFTFFSYFLTFYQQKITHPKNFFFLLYIYMAAGENCLQKKTANMSCMRNRGILFPAKRSTFTVYISPLSAYNQQSFDILHKYRSSMCQPTGFDLFAQSSFTKITISEMPRWHFNGSLGKKKNNYLVLRSFLIFFFFF